MCLNGEWFLVVFDLCPASLVASRCVLGEGRDSKKIPMPGGVGIFLRMMRERGGCVVVLPHWHHGSAGGGCDVSVVDDVRVDLVDVSVGADG